MVQAYYHVTGKPSMTPLVLFDQWNHHLVFMLLSHDEIMMLETSEVEI